MRSSWTDININWVDYLEARVEALEEDNKRLRCLIKILTEKEERDEMPSVLVC
jgi:hypothetical protein